MTSKRVWFFDLDNTLHNAGASSFRYFDGAMNSFIRDALKVDDVEADRLRALYWARYGNTLLGLSRHHGIRVAHFVEETHRFPGLEQQVVGHARDLRALRTLPGRKIVVTNAGRDYAVRVLRSLGILSLFDDVVGVEQMSLFGRLRPKPDRRMLKALAVQLKVPIHRCVLVEDSLSNQRAAHAVGVRTIWMQRWIRDHGHGPERGTRLRRRPSYVYARISSLQQLQRVL